MTIRPPVIRPASGAIRCAAVLALGLLASACAGLGGRFEAPEVSLMDLTPLPGGAFEQRFRVDLRLRNPNDHDLAIDGIDFELDVNGHRLTRGMGGEFVRIPRLGEATVSVRATTTLFDLVQQIARATEATHFEYELRGRVFLAHSMRRLTFERAGRIPE